MISGLSRIRFSETFDETANRRNDFSYASRKGFWCVIAIHFANAEEGPSE